MEAGAAADEYQDDLGVATDLRHGPGVGLGALSHFDAARDAPFASKPHVLLAYARIWSRVTQI